MKAFRLAAALALLGLTSGAGATSGFGISPLRLDLSAARPMASFTLNNAGDVPVVIQVHPRQWRQDTGDDVLADTRAFLVNPPIVRLQPGESQVVRVALRGAPDRDRETGYRMHFTEVPQSDSAPGSPGAMNVRMVKRMDVPVFVAPLTGKPQPRGELRASARDGAIELDFSNGGSGHWRLADIELSDAVTGAVLSNPFLVSVLPGGRRVLQFPLRTGTVPEMVRLKADAGGEPFDEKIPVARTQ